jgi:hypothetical protein
LAGKLLEGKSVVEDEIVVVKLFGREKKRKKRR